MVSESTKTSAFRIIDASFNRAMEGLRVVEECTRMHLNDRMLSTTLKQNRHRLAEAIGAIPSEQLLICRDILHDVGTTVQTDSEYQRQNIDSIVRANFARVLQSLRSIEEYSKLVAPEISSNVEAIRYQTYSMEKTIVNVLHSSEDLGSASVYVLIDRRESVAAFKKLVADLIEAEVDLIQLRDKRLEDRELVEVGRWLTDVTRETSTRWIMNDRADLAVLCDADGVHVGQTDIDVPAARKIVGVEKIVGVSTHNFEQAQQAVLNGANYIGVGPVFPSRTKSFEEFATQEFVAQVMSEISLPSFAIGGINLENVGRLIEAGVSRIAVSGAVLNAESPALAARELKLKLQFDSTAQCEQI